MRKEKLKTIEIIPLKDFKDKIKQTKKYKDCRISLLGNTHLYIERWKYE